MPEILKLKPTCKLHSSAILYEGYTVESDRILANVGIDKIEEVLQHFIAIHDEPLFFILELPASLDVETPVAPGVLKKTHTDVYYIDGCTVEQALVILIRAGKLLINDGLCTFGFGGHQSGDEILFGNYNILTIFSNELSSFEDFFEPHEIPKVEPLVTAWDVITKQTPGVSERYEWEGKTIYDIPDMFKEWGIYLAEQREDP